MASNHRHKIEGYCITTENIYNGHNKLVIRKNTLCVMYKSSQVDKRCLIKMFKDDIKQLGIHGVELYKFIDVTNNPAIKVLYGSN